MALPRAVGLSEAAEGLEKAAPAKKQPATPASASASAGAVAGSPTPRKRTAKDVAPPKTVSAPAGPGSISSATTATSTGRAVMADYRSIANELRAANAEKKAETKDLSLVVANILAELGKLDPKALAKAVEKAGFDSTDDKSEDKKVKKDKASAEFFDGKPVPGQDGFVFVLKKGKPEGSQDRSDYRIDRKVDWEASKDSPAKPAGLINKLFPGSGN